MGSTEHQRQIIDTFVNSVYVFDDRVVLNFNFTDDAKTVTREEVLGSSAVDNAPPDKKRLCRCSAKALLFCSAVGLGGEILIGASAGFPAAAFLRCAGVLCYNKHESPRIGMKQGAGRLPRGPLRKARPKRS